MNNYQKLDELKVAFAKKPGSLPLRNAIAHLESKLCLEPTALPIDPLKLLDYLEQSAPTSNRMEINLGKTSWWKRIRYWFRSIRTR